MATRPQIAKDSNEERVCLFLDPTSRNDIKEFAAQHKIGQGEVVEVLLKLVNRDMLHNALREQYKAKPRRRNGRGELLKKLRDYTPEQLEALQKLVHAQEQA